MDILGVRVDNMTKKEILEKTASFLSESGFHQIATVNPEFILEADKDDASKSILNSCNLNIADGFGISCAFLRHGKVLKSRIAGADLMMEIFRIADQKKTGLFLAANKDGLSSFEEIRLAILKLYPDLDISGVDLDRNDNDYLIRDDSRKIALCNFGNPFQERFLRRQNSAKISLAMGVGGSFDYLTGKMKRAPFWMRSVGLEWLWRLILQPKKRFKRIFNAVVVFPLKIIINR